MLTLGGNNSFPKLKKIIKGFIILSTISSTLGQAENVLDINSSTKIEQTENKELIKKIEDFNDKIININNNLRGIFSEEIKKSNKIEEGFGDLVYLIHFDNRETLTIENEDTNGNKIGGTKIINNPRLGKLCFPVVCSKINIINIKEVSSTKDTLTLTTNSGEKIIYKIVEKINKRHGNKYTTIEKQK